MTTRGPRPDAELLAVAVAEARAGLAEGGIPIGAALFGADGTLLGRGPQPSGAGRRPRRCTARPTRSATPDGSATYRGTTMVTTLSPCWFCSGLVRQFGIAAVVIGEARTFYGGHDWLAENGVEVVVLDDRDCIALMTDFIAANPALWNEDIGED